MTQRCDESLGVYAIAPVEFIPCEPGKQLPITLKVHVVGVAEQSFSLTLDAGLGCPGFGGDGGLDGEGGLDAGTDASG